MEFGSREIREPVEVAETKNNDTINKCGDKEVESPKPVIVVTETISRRNIIFWFIKFIIFVIFEWIYYLIFIRNNIAIFDYFS